MKACLYPALALSAVLGWPGSRPLHAAAEEKADSAAVRVELMDGALRTGVLLDAPDSTSFLLRSADGPLTVRTAEILQMTFRRELPYRPPDPGVVLRGGDRLSGRVGSLDRGRISVRTRHLGAVNLNVNEAATFILGPSSPAKAAGQSPPGLVLANGSFVGGSLRWLNEEAVAVDSPVLGLVEVPRGRVQQCLLADVIPRTPRERRAEVRLINGDRVTGRLVRLGQNALTIEAPWLGQRSVPIRDVQRIRFVGGRVRPLTDLRPSSTKTVPFFDTILPPRKGAGVGGRPLRIGRRSYTTGWGVESRTELTFRLDGKYRYFRTDIGIDEQVGDGGSVIFIVELNNKPVFKSDCLTGAQEAVRVHLNVAGAEVMRLIVDYADEANVRDHADWAEPVLIAAE